MTDDENRDLSDARLSLTCIPEGSPTRKIWERILDDLQKKDRELECLRKSVTAALPALDAAASRYGCAGMGCGTNRCHLGYLCHAGRVLQAAKSLRACLGMPEDVK